nr:NUDIX hydrolase [Maliibacterium massiliense]
MEKEARIAAQLAEKVQSRRQVYAGKVIDIEHWVVALPDGRQALREIIVHPGAAAVVPVDDAGNVTMVYQYRQPIGRVTLEIPAGKREHEEDPLLCARRELEEEVALKAQNYQLLTCLATSPGIFDERIWIYLATGLSGGVAHPDADEFLHIQSFPIEELMARIDAGEIQDGKTIVGLSLAHRALARMEK